MAAVYNKTLSRLLFAGLLVVVSCSLTLGQAGNFRSIGSGDWDNPNTWERDADSNGSFEESPSTVSPSSTSGTIQILNGHTVSIVNDVTIDQTTVESGGALTIDPNTNFLTVNVVLNNGTGDDLILNGSLSLLDDFFSEGSNLSVGGSLVVNTGGSIFVNDPFLSSLSFSASSTYQHNRDGGTIPAATWNASSNCLVTGITTTVPTGLSQTFGNFTWNCSGQVGTKFLGLTNSSVFQGSFNVQNTNGALVALTQTTAATIVVQNDFQVTGAARVGITNTGNVTLRVNRDFIHTTSGNSTLSGNTGAASVEVKRHFTISGGALTKAGAGSAGFVFNGSSVQNFTGGSAINGPVSYTVANGATFNLGTSALIGAGLFSLQGGGTIHVKSPNGLNIPVTGLGNIQTTSRSYSAAGNIVYNGTSSQNLGDEWSSSGSLNGVAVNLEIANSVGGVTNNIIGSTSLVGNLTLTSGSFNIGNSNTLIIQSNFNGNGGTIGGDPTANLTFSGSGTVTGTLNFTAGLRSLSNFTINRSGNILLGTDLTIGGVLDFPSSGNLEFDSFDGQTLTINGNIDQSGSGSGGLISGTSFQSNIAINGTGALTALPFCSLCETNQLNTVTLSRTGGGSYTWNSAVTITGTLNLVSGVLTHSSGLTMGNGATIVRSGGSIINDRPDIVSGSYNVTYSPGSSINTGLELPGPTDLTQLNNLTINGPTTLTQNVTINGNVSLFSGTFSGGANTITMQGNSWSKGGGSFTPGTSQVTFNGTTTITSSGGTPQFGNIRVESSRTLTFHTGTTSVSGNVTFIAGSTVNPNGGTLLLNGSGTQNFGGGGSTINNITITKSGGAVNLTSALSITGLLNITSATVFASSGNLILLSSSDGTTGNASIADLSGGGSVTGDVVVQRLVSGEGRVWRYLSSPIQNASVASWKDDFPITGTFSDPSTNVEWPGLSPALTTSAVSMYRYNETVVGTRDLGWEAFPTTGLANANPLEVGRGYSAFVRITPASTVIDVTGPINSGDIAMPVTLTGAGGANNDNGWNLLGNPYPSTIDWDSPNWTKTNISGVVQIRDDPSGIFRSWNGSVGSMGSGRIATGQGFWVQAVGSPTLTARESVKTNTTGAFYKEDDLVPNAFEITLAKGADKDFAYLWFKEDATEEADAEYDAAKFNNDIFDFALLTNNGTPLAINTLPFLTCGSEIKMSLSTINTEYSLTGSYTLEFNELGDISPDVKIKLIDTYAGNEMEISNGVSYAFDVDKNVQATFGSNRFKLQLIGGMTIFEVTAAVGGTSCKTGSVILNASGAPSGGVYKWYESSSSELALAESAEPEFTTPVLDKTKTYYVSVANALGCESSREAVVAKVINFDDVTIEEVENKLVSSYEEGNQWFRDGILIGGATSQEFTPSESGVYKVEVVIEGCKTSSERTYSVTGLENDLSDSVLTLYPNPVENTLSIRVMDNSITRVAITDLNGRHVGEVQLNKNGKHRDGEFDFKGKAEGVYLIQISDVNGNKISRRIVKN